MRFLGPGLLLLCTAIWGSAFVAQKLGADHFGPFAINSFRNLLAGAFLWLCLLLRHRFSCGDWPVRPNRRALLGGFLCGLLLFAAMISQQIGIERTTPGISAFLTSNYVLIVPLLAWAVGKGRPGLGICLGVLFALAGAYLISVSPSATSGFVLDAGAAWILLCAAFFAVHILVVDGFAPGCDMLALSAMQMSVAGIVALPFVFLPGELARLSWAGFRQGLPALLFLGFFSSGIAYTLQNFGQAFTPPALAAIIMALESVFGVFFGWLILGDVMTARQAVGCAFVFSAVIVSQVLSRKAPA